jgi:hypothetical protein
MTLFSSFIPTNPFEIMIKKYLEVEECSHSDSIIDNLYYSIYSHDDTPFVKSIKFNQINIILNIITSIYNENPSSITHFKNDIDLIMVFEKITVKVFNLKKIQLKHHDELYSLLSLNECPYLEHIYTIFSIDSSNLFFVISKTIDTKSFKKIIPIVAPIIHSHVDIALRYLLSYGWNHNDVSIDNLGLDQISNNFVLFDFGLAKNNIFDKERLLKRLDDDFAYLNKSILYHSSLD